MLFEPEIEVFMTALFQYSGVVFMMVFLNAACESIFNSDSTDQRWRTRLLLSLFAVVLFALAHPNAITLKIQQLRNFINLLQ